MGHALMRIHSARVCHNDKSEKNILFVRESGNVRVVIIHFTCAWLDTHSENLEAAWDTFLGGLSFYMVIGAENSVLNL